MTIECSSIVNKELYKDALGLITDSVNCEYCNDDIFKMLGLFTTTPNYRVYDVYIYNGHLIIEDDINEIVKFKYCPMCGGKL
jgi:hypothetical protein